MGRHEVRGIRDARDIIDAAVTQGYTFEPPRNGGTHSRLVPPNGGAPVGISSSPSDTNYRLQIIRQLRKSGFVWKPRDTKKETKMNQPVEQWALIPRTRAELSNGGLVRHAVTGRPIKPMENGIVKVTDEHGFSVDKSVRGECRRIFGEPPIKALYRHDFYDTPAPSVTVEHPEPVQEPPAPEAPSEWQPVLIEGVLEGYEVNEDAQVMTPDGKFGRRLLTPTQMGTGVWVQLRSAGSGNSGRYRLDEIVLEAFEPRPGGGFIAKHLDDDQANCKRSNLKWAEGTHPRAKTRKKETEPVPISVVNPPLVVPGTIPGEPPIALEEPEVRDTIAPVSSEFAIVKSAAYHDPVSGWMVAVSGGRITLPKDVPVEHADIIRKLLEAVEADQ